MSEEPRNLATAQSSEAPDTGASASARTGQRALNLPNPAEPAQGSQPASAVQEMPVSRPDQGARVGQPASGNQAMSVAQVSQAAQPVQASQTGQVPAPTVEGAADLAEGAKPVLQVTAGGKPRPSVASKKRAHGDMPVSDGGTRQDGSEGQVPLDRSHPAGQEDSTASADTPTTRTSVTEKKKHGPVFKVLMGVLVVVAVFALVCGAIACLRWAFPHDQQDLQGTWAMEGAANPIVITEDQIDLAGAAHYDYQIDTTAKTLSVSFSGLEGQSHYRFSRDRDSLAIIEGVDCSWQATLFEDLAWMWSDFVGSLQGEASDPLGSEQGIVVYRQATATQEQNASAAEETEGASVASGEEITDGGTDAHDAAAEDASHES